MWLKIENFVSVSGIQITLSSSTKFLAVCCHLTAGVVCI